MTKNGEKGTAKLECKNTAKLAQPERMCLSINFSHFRDLSLSGDDAASAAADDG